MSLVMCDIVDYGPYTSTTGSVYLEWRHVMVCEEVESQACLVSVGRPVRIPVRQEDGPCRSGGGEKIGGKERFMTLYFGGRHRGRTAEHTQLVSMRVRVDHVVDHVHACVHTQP
jgi:hypothetical protein